MPRPRTGRPGTAFEPCGRFVQPLLYGGNCTVCGFSEREHLQASLKAAAASSPTKYGSPGGRTSLKKSQDLSSSAPLSITATAQKLSERVPTPKVGGSRAQSPRQGNVSQLHDSRGSKPRQTSSLRNSGSLRATAIASSREMSTRVSMLERAAEAAEKRHDYVAAERRYVQAARAAGRDDHLSTSQMRTQSSRPLSKVQRAALRNTRSHIQWGDTTDMDGGDDNPYVDEQEQDYDEQDLLSDPTKTQFTDPYDLTLSAEDRSRRIDYKLNAQLSRTIMSPRELPQRHDLMAADEALLDVIGWHDRMRARFTRLFHHFTNDAPHMTFKQFCAMMQEIGVGAGDAIRLFRASDRLVRGTWLSVGDVIMGMAVVHPHTPHKGAWLRVRGGALFRAYSTNSRTMSKEQLYTFVSDCLRHHPDGTARLAHTRKQYRGAARIGLTGTTDRAMHLTHEIMASICGVDAQQALSQSQFVNELLAGRLPECSLLLRFKVA
eukprot:m.249160 g.249160  ORF g.249160 m.249160 type:complete len:491 (+) comp15426_c0_seq5:2734-4206(+)